MLNQIYYDCYYNYWSIDPAVLTSRFYNIKMFYYIKGPLCLRNNLFLFFKSFLMFVYFYSIIEVSHWPFTWIILFISWFLAIHTDIVNKYWRLTTMFTFYYFYYKLFHIYWYFFQVTSIKHFLKPFFKHYKTHVEVKFYLFQRYNLSLECWFPYSKK
jgi:hypothetical protein